jgi:hypothetical protein
MGVKYTSFVLPIAVLACIAVVTLRNPRQFAAAAAWVLGAALLTALPWYLRNFSWTGNPVYPFVFGGPFWDAFRADHYSGPGTGIGWNLAELGLLPLTATLGIQDQNYFDGRFGPFFLIFAPLLVWVALRLREAGAESRAALGTLLVFATLSAFAWTYGVIQTVHLRQARLLWPALIPLVPLISAGIDRLGHRDLPGLRIHFIVSAMLALAVFANLFDFGLQVIARNPLAAALGLQSRHDYSSRVQPEYTAALDLVNGTPPDASVYLLFEPRSYGMNRTVQPDPINDNFEHDLYLHGDADGILRAWGARGYTHVLIFWWGAEFLFAEATPDAEQLARLSTLASRLEIAGSTPDGDYVLYRIPSP